MHREGNKGQQELQNERFDKSFHQCNYQPGVSISFFLIGGHQGMTTGQKEYKLGGF